VTAIASAATVHDKTVTDPTPLAVERQAAGRGLRVTSPALPGWVAVTRSPEQLARAVADALTRHAADTEAASATAAPAPAPNRASRRTVRRIERAGARPVYRLQHDPADWTPQPDGSWIAPNGYRYGPGTYVVTRIVAARLERGLPVRAADETSDPPSPPCTRRGCRKAAARRGMCWGHYTATLTAARTPDSTTLT
jgi:hypothetical protein